MIIRLGEARRICVHIEPSGPLRAKTKDVNMLFWIRNWRRWKLDLQTEPAEALNVPVIPLGALMSAIHPLVSRPPYALAYLGYQVSARQMMDPILFQKLVMNNFCKCHSFLNKHFLVFNLGVHFFLLSFCSKSQGWTDSNLFDARNQAF